VTYLSSGWTGAEMAAILYRSSKTSGLKTAEVTSAYDYLNMSQLAMFSEHDWSDLLNQDDTFTTDGATSYDLTVELETHFGRVKDGSVRCGSYNLSPTSKYQRDMDDPDRTGGGVPSEYCIVNRNDFRILPYGSSGDIIYIDWIGMPVKIDSTTTATQMSFKPERQQIILQGAIWMMMRDYTQPDWIEQYRLYREMLKDAIKNDSMVNYGYTVIQPVDC